MSPPSANDPRFMNSATPPAPERQGPVPGWRGLPRRDRWLLLLYFAVLVFAELLSTQPNELGLWLHAALVVSLLAHAALAEGGLRGLLVGMAVLPLIRLLSFTMPFWLFPRSSWFALINAPILLGVITAAILLGYGRNSLGLRVGNLAFQLAIGVTGILIGLLERLLIQPEALVDSVASPEAVWVVASLMVFTGFGEELLFRGLLQHGAVRVLGPVGGIAFGSILFGSMHIGWLSIPDVAFVTLVGVVFGILVHRTGSILGVSIAHGLANVMLFVVLPLAASGRL